MNLTSIIRPFFVRRAATAHAHAMDVEATQRALLEGLVATARDTEWGRAHSYGMLRGYADYRQAVAVTPYEDMRPLVMRMIDGERNVLWPGRVTHYAQSSGTSDGKSKYIPITAEGFRDCHYRGGADVVAHYLSLYPDSHLFDGRSFILGGSFANELELPVKSHVKVGDLSANLIDNINPVVNLLRIPDKQTALMADWHEKLPRLIERAAHANVTNISGVPSWFLTVLQGILKHTGAKELHDVWPNLEVFFHGGIAFGPYRSQYNAIINPERMRYLETYNASEGFFGIQDTRESKAMLLLVDAGTFYEFIPVNTPDAEPLPCWEVEQGKVYALVISNCNGLWRYPIGDTVKIESTSPLRITIAGRTKHFINAFGEEVMVHNTDAALERTCAMTGASVLNYTAAPVYSHDGQRGRHQWLIEFATPPSDMDRFAALLDESLTHENSDYQAKRSGNIFLDPLTVTIAPQGLFDRWLEATGKLGGQRKVPRLSNDRKIIDSMIKMI